VKITINIDTCERCRHVDHSGSFTVRGARLICGHSDACMERTTWERFFSEYPEYKDRDYNPVHFRYHWIHRVLTSSSREKVEKIPDWCPIKHGAEY